MTVVGLAWPMLMWLTPAADRPWISGTSDNSVWSLILGYNGLGRLFGQSGGPGGSAGGGPGGGFGGGGLFGGDPGPLRLLNQALGGQAGWLLGVAVVGGLGLLAATRLRRSDPRTGWLLLVGGAFLTTAVAFSRAEGIFHPYYVSQLAPFIAALVGATAALVLGRGTVARIAGPAAVVAGVIAEIAILRDNPGSLSWWPPLLAAGGVAAAVCLAVVLAPKARALVVAGAIAMLLLAPGAWAAQTLGHATSGTFPAGGPATTRWRARRWRRRAGGPPGGGAGGGMFGGDTGSLTEAIAYADANGGGTIAVASQSGAAGSLITSGAKVVAIGGFSGRESQVTTGGSPTRSSPARSATCSRAAAAACPTTAGPAPTT